MDEINLLCCYEVDVITKSEGKRFLEAFEKTKSTRKVTVRVYLTRN